MATEEAFGDEHLDRPPPSILVSVQTDTGDEEGEWHFGNMASGSSFGREQRRLVLSNIGSLVSRAWMPAPDIGLDELRHVERGLPGHLTLMELHCALTNEAESKSRAAEIRRLEELVRAAEKYWEALRVPCERMAEPMAEGKSLTTGRLQAKAEHDTFNTTICKLEAAAVTVDGEVGIVVGSYGR